MSKKLYILSVDGGGLKGLVAIRILKIIEDITKKRITDTFNLMGGTSTGGLIVSALTVKEKDKDKPRFNLDQIEGMYLEAAQTVFQQGGFNLTGYETDHLNNLLERCFDSIPIADTLIPIFVPTYDLNENRIIVFKTRSAREDQTKNITLFDVGRATSAIPPVFPTYSLKYNNRELKCIDSGYYIKNPSIAVLAEAWKHKEYYVSSDVKEEDIVLLSVSTGNFSQRNKSWSSDIDEVLPDQGIAKKYIKDQGLKIDLRKVKYMRIDLNFGGGAFNLMKLIEVGDRLEGLSQDGTFRNEISNLLKN
ncbi:MAG: patatin family protein [Bacteroidota bacterium]|jgi:patatin-like phospholipase/acyl hydrolase|nr:patatin family protein [Bacteroidota bacterium]